MNSVHKAVKISRVFGCKGLAPEEMYPQDTHVVLDVDPETEKLVIHLDPFQNCTAKPAVQRFINFCLYQQLPLIIVEGERRKFIGENSCGKR